MTRRNISSASPWEPKVGFSRAVRVGNMIVVSGTGPVAPDGSTACVGDAYGQAKRCFEIIKEAIENAGGRLEDVVRTRMYVTDETVESDIGRAHSEFFDHIRPAATMVIVKGLVSDDWFVEIEAECILSE